MREKKEEVIGLLLLFFSVSFSSKSLESRLPNPNGGFCTCQEFFMKSLLILPGYRQNNVKNVSYFAAGTGRASWWWPNTHELFWCKFKSLEDIKSMKNCVHPVPSQRRFFWYFSSSWVQCPSAEEKPVLALGS